LRYLNFLSEKTTVILNEAKIPPISLTISRKPYPSLEDVLSAVSQVTKKVVHFDAEKLAMEAGNKLAVNAVMLGAASALLGSFIKKEILLDALLSRLAERVREVNRKAFESGYVIASP